MQRIMLFCHKKWNAAKSLLELIAQPKLLFSRMGRLITAAGFDLTLKRVAVATSAELGRLDFGSKTKEDKQLCFKCQWSKSSPPAGQLPFLVSQI